MSSTLISQVEATETKSNLRETATEIASVITMWAVTAVTVILLSLQWVA